MSHSTASSPFARPEPWNLVADGYVKHIAPHLERYAIDALRLADVRADERVLDVATGPGTLALRAARITDVHALDFSAEMLMRLRARAIEEGLLHRITTVHGDGQRLDYPDACFDAAFSMFGLFMFPDRHEGLSEMARVLRPGGRCVVASWGPMKSVPALAVATEIVQRAVRPEAEGPPEDPPLSSPDAIEREMSAAGFTVEVHPVTHALEAADADTFVEGLVASHVGLTWLASTLDPAQFAEVRDQLRTRLERTLGSGPVRVDMPAWLGLGRKPDR